MFTFNSPKIRLALFVIGILVLVWSFPVILRLAAYLIDKIVLCVLAGAVLYVIFGRNVLKG